MKFILQIIFILFCSLANAQQITTIAGMLDSTGSRDSTVFLSKFNNPHGVAINNNGDIFIADRFNHVIRKIDTNGLVTTLAGSGNVGRVDGVGSQASFNEPWDIEVDINGNIIVADTRNNLIRKITPTGIVTTLAGSGSFGYTDNSNPLATSFGNPSGIAIDKQNNIYVADHLTHVIRKISISGAVSTLAGSKVNFPNNFGTADGVGMQAKFYRPYGISIGIDDYLYVADEWNHLIRKVSLLGQVSTIAGSGVIGSQNGKGAKASFNYPWDIIQDSNLNLYVIDGYNHVIRKIDTANNVTDFMGLSGISGATDGNSSVGTFNGATGLTFDKKKNLIYIADTYNELIRKITIGNMPPTIVTDRKMVCKFDTIKVTVSPAIFNSYEYYINDSLFHSSINPIQEIVVPYTGIVKLEVKAIHDDYEAKSNIIYLNSFPNEQPVITYDTAFLANQDSILLLSSLGNQYVWSTGDTTQSIYVKEVGVYVITVVNAFGCVNSSEDVLIVKENETDYATIKVVGALDLCPLDSCLLYAKNNQPIWYKNNTPYANFASVISVKDSGSYYYVYYDSLGNLKFSDTINITNKTLAVSKLNYRDTAFLNIPVDFNLYITDTINKVLSWNDTLLVDTLFPSSFGSYYATYDVQGCQQNTDTILIEELIELRIGLALATDSVAFINNHSFCEGDVVNIIGDYKNVEWYIDDSLVGRSDSIFIVDTTCSVYYTYLFNSKMASSDTIHLTMNKIEAPELSITVDTLIFNGEKIAITTNSTGNILWSNGAIKDTAFIDSTLLLSLQLTDSNNCKALSDTLSIQVIEMPEVLLSITTDSSFCYNDSIIVRSNYANVTWVINDSIIDSNVSYIVINETSSVSVYYDTLGRRFYSDTITLDKLEKVNSFISTSSAISFYAGDSVELFANKANSYHWNTGDTSIRITVTSKDTNWFIGIDSNGCSTYSDTLYTEVIVIPSLQLAVLGDSIICNGDSTILLSNVPKPVWYRNGQVLGDTSILFYGKDSGAYHYSYYFNNDTTLFSDTVYIGNYPIAAPVLNIVADTMLYYGNSIAVFTNTTYPSYYWSTGDTNGVLIVDSTRTICLTVEDHNGCLSTSDTISISAILLPDLKINAIDDTAFCLGESAVIETSRTNTELVTWYRDNQLLSTGVESLNVRDSGYYYYTTLFLNDTLLISDSIWIEVFQLPVVDFYAEKTVLNKIENIVYSSPVVSAQVIDFEWSFGDEYAGDLDNFSTQREGEHQYTYPGLYTLSLIVTDVNGCQNRIEKLDYITVENDLFIPSGFTPNGDGENDLFRPLGGGITEGEILIFNQWGELIFQTNDVTQGWNGTRNTKEVESGNYTYVMKLVDISSSIHTKKGVVSLIR